MAGKRVRCRKCGQAIAVPRPPASDDDPPELGFLEAVESRGTVVNAPAPMTPHATSPARMPMHRDDARPAPPTIPHTPAQYPGNPMAAYAGTTRARTRAQVFDDPSLNSLTVLLLVLFCLAAIVLPILIFTLDNYGVTNEVAIPITIGCVFAFYFGIITPGTMAGVWTTCKLFQRPTPPKLYLRAAGVHLLFYVVAIALQIPIGILAGVLGGLGVPPIVLIVVMVLSVAVQVRVLFWSYHRYFETPTLHSLVAMIFSWIITAVVLVPAMFLAVTLFNSLAVPEKKADPYVEEFEKEMRNERIKRVRGYQAELTALKSQVGPSTRYEEISSPLKYLETTLVVSEPTLRDIPGYAEVRADAAQFRQAVDKLPRARNGR